jgi:hypothetical protein
MRGYLHAEQLIWAGGMRQLKYLPHLVEFFLYFFDPESGGDC